MIEKMIKIFEENYNKEIYGEGNLVLTPMIIKTMFERSDIFKLLNVEYSEETKLDQLKTMLLIGGYSYFNDGFNKDNFLTKKYMGCTVHIELTKILSHEIISKFEKYLVSSLINRVPDENKNQQSLKDVSKYLYAPCRYERILTSKCFLNEEDLKRLHDVTHTEFRTGNFVHLRDNIFVDRYEEVIEDKIIFICDDKICNHNPSQDIIMFKFCKDDTKLELYFDASLYDFISDVNYKVYTYEVKK